MTDGPTTPTELEIRVIDSRSPHFFTLECWALWDQVRNDYVRVPGSSDRIRRFYTLAAAEAFQRSLGHRPT
ncbi:MULTISPECIES: hypothetical protein [unclassified Kitasatospora]|uniref:hypothetical protein n=1 Tax=unclassified Kitasatospora TaxID=2633591 RepID=UPI0033F3535E